MLWRGLLPGPFRWSLLVEDGGMSEEPLPGGFVGDAVRVGETVRKAPPADNATLIRSARSFLRQAASRIAASATARAAGMSDTTSLGVPVVLASMMMYVFPWRRMRRSQEASRQEIDVRS
jgi:hypothetical protein